MKFNVRSFTCEQFIGKKFFNTYHEETFKYLSVFTISYFEN